MKRHSLKKYNYCPRCAKVREVVEDVDELICKTCFARQRKRKVNVNNFLIGK